MAFDQQRFGKYRLLRRIAAGGMGEVHLAKLSGPSGFEKLVVIKRLLEARRADAKYVEMFFSEARVAAQLTHSNIAQIYETGQVDAVPYIAMEYVHGKSLRKILDQAELLGARGGSPRVPAAFVGSIVVQLCRGLSFAHEAHHLSGAAMGLIHRDINPLNVLVSYQGEVKIIDFGIAKSELNIDKTQAGTIKGTVVYMSPEQSLGHPLDRRSDLFSVGICLYEALSGKNPFHKGTLGASLDAIRRAAAPPLADAPLAEVRAFAGIVARVLQSRPDDRYADCVEMADAIEAVLSSGQLPRPPENLSAYLRRLFADDIREEEQSLERTDSASLDDLAAVPPARGAGTAILPAGRPAEVTGSIDGGPLNGERTSGGRPVAQVSSVHARLQGLRAGTSQAHGVAPGTGTDSGLALPAAAGEGADIAPASLSAEHSSTFVDHDDSLEISLDTPTLADRQEGAAGWVARLSPLLAGWVTSSAARSPGRQRRLLALAAGTGAVALACFWALSPGHEAEPEAAAEVTTARPTPPARPSRPAQVSREAPSFLEGEIDEATQTPLKRYRDDAAGLHLFEEGGSQAAPASELQPRPPTVAATPKRVAPEEPSRRTKRPRAHSLRPVARAIRPQVGVDGMGPTVRIRADPPLSMRHNGRIGQNPVHLHDGKGLLELRGGPGGHTFVVRVHYQSLRNDVTFSIDSDPWADVYGAGGISLGRTPVRILHAGDSTALVLKNPKLHTPQHLTLKLVGQAAFNDE